MRPLVVLAALALAACGSSEESTTIGGTTFSQDEAEGTATISNERGSITALEGGSADNTKFPDFAPRYPGSQVESAIVTKSEGREQTMALLNTSDDVATVADFYREKLTAAGLTIKSNFSAEDAAMISAEGDAKKANVTVGKQDGKTAITVSFSGA